MPDFLVGLDLGQTADPSALAILKRSMVLKDGMPHRHPKRGILSRFSCVHLQRFPLHTSYPRVVASVARILDDPLLKPFRPRLVIDATGVGRPVMDLFIAAKQPAEQGGGPLFRHEDMYAITITGGDKWSAHAYSGTIRGFHVPKAELASTVDAALSSGRLEFCRSADARTSKAAKEELKSFHRGMTRSGRPTSAAHDGAHDDLVMALAIAMWVGCRPELSHQAAVEFANAGISQRFDTARYEEMGPSAQNPEFRALVHEHRAEREALAAQEEEERKALEAWWHSPENPHWWQ